MKPETFRKRIKREYASGVPGRVVDADYFYFDTDPHEMREVAIVCGGYEKCAGDFSIKRQNYPYYFVKYTLKGRGTLEIDGGIVELKPGVLTGFGPGTAHSYKADAGDPMEHIFVTFLGSKAGELIGRSALGQGHFIEPNDPEGAGGICQKILANGLEKPAYAQEICCNYLHVLLLEYACSSSMRNANIPMSLSTYLGCKRYIDSNFSFIGSPGEVADKCGVDVRYMSFLFKKYDHLTPSHYIMRLKLNKAANLLLTSDMIIKEVAAEVGFDDAYHFSKNFKKFHGSSPKMYRWEHMRAGACGIAGQSE